MKKIKIFLIMTLVLLIVSQLSLSGQTIFWVESAFDSPRLVKTDAEGTELFSQSLPAASLPQSIAISAEGDALLWTELAFAGARIQTTTADFDAASVLVDSQSVMRGIAIDTLNNKIYWTATNLISGPKIFRADMDSLSPVVLVDFGPGSNSTPRAICLDIEDGKMYWTNFAEGKIQRADLSVGAVAEDILSDLNGPAGLAVEPILGKIFWTEMNGHQIRSADLNGENDTVLVSDLSYPNSLSVSPGKNRMAWTEMGTGKVKSAALDGSDIFDYGIEAIAPAGILIEPAPVSDIRDAELHLPLKFALGQNFPNPFNPQTNIQYTLPQKAAVRIAVYDLLGRKIKSLLDEQKPAGHHSIKFEARNMASGIYIYQIITDTPYAAVRKMILLK